MADFDNADCLARLRVITDRPAADQDLTDVVGYQCLSTAQRNVADVLAEHIPWTNWTLPALMVTSDNKVYSLAASAEPLGPMEITAKIGDPPMVEAALWDTGGDYTREGAGSIRITGGGTRTFVDGAPYARFFPAPGKIDAGTQPTLKPTRALEAVIYLAGAAWAERGGTRDPLVYERRAHQILWGDENLGGLIPAMKRQVESGAPAGLWWRGSPDLRGGV